MHYLQVGSPPFICFSSRLLELTGRRTRRLKCDEQLPKCNRCTVGLRKCIWNENKAVKSSVIEKGNSGPKFLLPRATDAMLLEPTSNLFITDQEWRYFKIYSTETHHELSGPYQSPFWSQIVLQAATHHPFIRSAIIAMGSLASIAKSPNLPAFKGPDYHSGPSIEEQFALAHYQKFLKGSRDISLQGDQVTRLTLITCLLVMCIESLQWNHATSLNAVWNGTKLMNQWLRSEGRKGRYLDCISSPNPLTVEDGIVQQFKLVDSQTAWLCDRRPLADHARLSRGGDETIRDMPLSFSSVDEARFMLDLISRRIHHFIVSVRPDKLGATDFSPPGQARRFKITMDREEPYDPLTFEQLALRQSYSEEIERWEVAFEAISKSTTEESPNFVAVNLLRVQSRFLPVQLIGETSITEMIYDEFLQNFRDMITYAKAHFSHPSIQGQNPRGVYSLNTGLIFPLHNLVRRCRDRVIRRQGIDMLVNNAWREGIHASSSSGRIGEYFMEVEERGIDPDVVIPEENRTVMFEMMYQELENMNTATVKSVRGVGNSREMLVERWVWSLDEIPWQEDRKTILSEKRAKDLENTKMSGGKAATTGHTAVKESPSGDDDQNIISPLGGKAAMKEIVAMVVPKDWQTRSPS